MQVEVTRELAQAHVVVAAKKSSSGRHNKLKQYHISSIEDQARGTLTSLLRGQLCLSFYGVGYIAKWLRVAEQYQLAWLKDVD
ncbi:hypothetical protein HaLaN_00750 [Haematococcus lacustris]|uniref:Uncharacterized protein n=1 Tax=Haematococcus lacustris TaxID=44745 RepID=A0A699Y9Z3_HAELA|nr:hypothetical protein HaLaN_00750 [Haematococcus lacustris]